LQVPNVHIAGENRELVQNYLTFIITVLVKFQMCN